MVGVDDWEKKEELVGKEDPFEGQHLENIDRFEGRFIDGESEIGYLFILHNKSI